MRQISILIVSILFISSLASQSAVKGSPKCEDEKFDQVVRKALSFTVPVMDVDILKKNHEQIIILDAREKEEYEVSHIPGAKWVGYSKINEELLKGIEKGQKIVLYCSIGYRSEKVGEKLKLKGFSNVYNLFGSIFEWSNRGYTLEDLENKKTNKVHTYNKKWSRLVNEKKVEKVW